MSTKRADETPGGGDGGIGPRTLGHLARASRLNAWIYGKLRADLGGDVLEVGSGLGSMSRLIVHDASELVLADVDPGHLEALRRDLSGAEATPDVDAQSGAQPVSQGGRGRGRVTVVKWDLDDPPPSALAGRRFDAVVAINVLEHVADDARAVCSLASLLRPGGRLLVYVPACPAAFGPLDEGLDHRRRYTRRSLGAILGQAGLSFPPPRYVNRLGLVGWLCVGRGLRRRALPPRLIDLFEHLVPAARALDAALAFCPVGLGLVARATRPGSGVGPIARKTPGKINNKL